MREEGSGDHTEDPRQEGKEPRTHGIVSTPEGQVLLIGTALAFLLVAAFAITYQFSRETGNGLVMITVTNMIFGRAAGMSLGYALGHEHLLVIPLNMVIESSLVLIFYPLFVLSWRHLTVFRPLGRYIERVRRSAERHRAFIQRWGIVGLFMFVFFPFSMTGPMVGCAIGFMMGLGTWKNMAVVLSGTFVAIVSWAMLLRNLLERLASYSSAAPIAVVATIMAVLVIMHVYRAVKKRRR
jgi:uncharacterized membrane protein